MESEGAGAFRNHRDSSTLEAFLGKHFPSSLQNLLPSLGRRRQPAGEYKIESAQSALSTSCVSR
jgi:hypothetical protein